AALDALAGRAETVEAYQQALAAAIGAGAAASWGAKIAFDRFPRMTFAFARMPVVWSVVERLLRGEISHPGASRGVARAAMRAIEALAKAAGNPGAGFVSEGRRLGGAEARPAE